MRAGCVRTGPLAVVLEPAPGGGGLKPGSVARGGVAEGTGRPACTGVFAAAPAACAAVTGQPEKPPGKSRASAAHMSASTARRRLKTPTKTSMNTAPKAARQLPSRRRRTARRAADASGIRVPHLLGTVARHLAAVHFTQLRHFAAAPVD